MDIKIRERYGKLFIAYRNGIYGRPGIVLTLYYPTGVSASDYPELIGATARPERGGLYSIEEIDGKYYYPARSIRVINGGQTKPEYSEEEEKPRPKLKREIRWNDIYCIWEGLYKTRPYWRTIK